MWYTIYVPNQGTITEGYLQKAALGKYFILANVMAGMAEGGTGGEGSTRQGMGGGKGPCDPAKEHPGPCH